MEGLKFTENPVINKKIAPLIESLRSELIEHFHPKSIILSGSFARGEATVIEKEGKLKFLSDCEIILIPNWYIFKRNKISNFCEDFFNRTGLKVDISGTILSFQLLVPFLRNLKPTINNYDLKYGSKTIYGRDYLKRLKDFKSEDIPLWEGIRLLFNRMIEALEYFSPRNPTEEMVFWTDKIVLACQDTLLLSLGKYHPSFKIRNKMFLSSFPKHFGELKDKIPNLPKITVEVMNRKLRGDMNVNEPVEYWFEVAEICDEVFRYIIAKDMRIKFGDYLEFQEKYINHPNLNRYTQLPFGNAFCQNLWSGVKRIFVHNKFFPLNVHKLHIPWAHLIYSTIPLIYFSLSRTENEININKKYLNQVLNIPFFKKKKSDNLIEEWEFMKNQIIQYWRQICW